VITLAETFADAVLRSAMKRLPRADGPRRRQGKTHMALVAGPLSPLNRGNHFPPTVVIRRRNLRMRSLPVSAYKSCRGLHAMPGERLNWALVGGPVVAAETRVHFRHSGDHAARDLADARIVGDVKVAVGVHGNAEEPLNWALVAGPLSPLKPKVHFPPQW